MCNMARGKKKKELTLEEKLERALVPVGEQPYKVPGNWCWVYSLNVFDIEYGKGLPQKDLASTSLYKIHNNNASYDTSKKITNPVK